MVEFRLLGPVEIRVEGRPVDAGQPRQRALLAALLVDAGRLVSMDTLIDRVWGQFGPASARHAVHTYLTRIRGMLAKLTPDDPTGRLAYRSGGYLLDVDPDQVDLHRFRRLVAEARSPRVADGDGAALLREALGLWHGEPLAGVTGEWAERIRDAYRGRRLDAVVLWAQAQLRCGDPDPVIDTVPELITEYPLVEPLTGVLMRALADAGRTAEALDRYTALRKRLVEELGTEPGAELQNVHRSVLRGDRLFGAPDGAPDTGPPGEPSPAAPPVPRTLPAPPPHFTGRAAELRTLTGMLATRPSSPDAARIVAIGGTAGVGKTALAVHWAHQVTDQFPDGQLYLDLRGFDPSGQVIPPAEAVRCFLDALTVSPHRIPASLDAQTALYRTLLAGKRVLIVLDNARDAGQVRPLLPGTPGCLVLVTSRNQLAGLVAVDGARPIGLDLLTMSEAGELLSRRLGSGRTAAEPGAVEEIATRCARLPLALAIVAARAVIHPDFGLGTLAADLRDTHHRWATFTAGDIATDVGAVFSWSYHALTPAAARLFRILGLHPGPDITAPAAASLAGVPVGQVHPLLAELTSAHLIHEHVPGRYALHDLLRDYAAAQGGAVDPDLERHAATRRLLDHYIRSAYAADRQLSAHRDPITLDPPEPGVTAESPTDPARALDWFRAEHPVLLATLGQTTATGADAATWRLAWSLSTYLERQAHSHESIVAATAAVAAAERVATPSTRAFAHRFLARGYLRLGRFGDADTELRRALDLLRAAGDEVGQAHTYLMLSDLWEAQDHHREGLEHARQALELYRAAGHLRGQADAGNTVGWCYALLGDYRRTLDYCEEALALHGELGPGVVQATTWDSLGYAHHHLGDHAAAVACYHQALDLFRELGDRYAEAQTLTHLGDTHDAGGDSAAARAAWQQAQAILHDIDHPDAEEIQAKLRPGRA